MIRLPTHRTLTVPNSLCAYCGTPLVPKSRSRDHVVARNFVPEGTLENSCNVGIWACIKCNGYKSELEDDISAISMMPGPDGNLARDDERLRRTLLRKQRGAISKATRRRVADSHTRLKVNMPFGGAVFSFGFTGQPTIAPNRAAWLAWAQIQGLWFHQTYDHDRKHGKYLPIQHFSMAGFYSRYDWGNARILSFAAQIMDWEHQTFACLADGYFHAVVKAAPDSETLAWATEWNDAYRCFGYWCLTDSWRSYETQLVQLKPDHMIGDTTNGWASRREIPFPEDGDDHLFAEPPDFEKIEVGEIRRV